MKASHPLSQQKLFLDLPAREIKALAELARPVHLARGQVLFRKGDPPGNVYFVVSGGAEVVLEGAARSDIVARLGPGECIGEMSALDGLPRSATVVAADDTEAYYLSTETFARYLETAPKVSLRLMQILATRMRRMVDGYEEELLLSEIWPRFPSA